ncbi:hypothetical protein LAZ67_2003499 [Cordylochernes scorpioides]|uniref:Uncharacterized protein n=1 Tax=Cordylochernes scorpioides TaxID=51811 RepID=A0ABY6K308_9ARAC|nr:hypothetical protein LAZ67_2003499 [Cordylochernes scorpioides]
MDIKNVRKWCREFNEGRINVHDEQRSGRPSLPESTVARIDEMVRANRRITLEEIEDGLNEDCSHFSMHKIVSETLGYRKVMAGINFATAAGWIATGEVSCMLACMKNREINVEEVDEAEALGLVKALENTTTLPNHLTLGFFLDNLLVVKSVLNSKTGNYLINRALLLISRLNHNGNRCTIQWIKGHSWINGQTLLMLACQRGIKIIVDQLLELRSDVNAVDLSIEEIVKEVMGKEEDEEDTVHMRRSRLRSQNEGDQEELRT